MRKRKDVKDENAKIEKLVREYSASTDLVSLDQKKMRITPVLPSSEHVWFVQVDATHEGRPSISNLDTKFYLSLYFNFAH
jgi:hypothetical protein